MRTVEIVDQMFGNDRRRGKEPKQIIHKLGEDDERNVWQCLVQALKRRKDSYNVPDPAPLENLDPGYLFFLQASIKEMAAP